MSFTIESGTTSFTMQRFQSVLCIRSLIHCALVLVIGSSARAMDLVRQETRADQAIAKYGMTGKGVTVAILDRGIDWRHPDFRNPDGTTRIKWMLDMSNAGFSPCDPNDPTPIEYSEAQINAALFGGPEVAERDALGHGTVTAGLAAGNGSAFANGKYRGMAPEADLIIVKFTSEGAPAHDSEPAETFFQGCGTTALNWLDQKLTQIGRHGTKERGHHSLSGHSDSSSRPLSTVRPLSCPGSSPPWVGSSSRPTTTPYKHRPIMAKYTAERAPHQIYWDEIVEFPSDRPACMAPRTR